MRREENDQHHEKFMQWVKEAIENSKNERIVEYIDFKDNQIKYGKLKDLKNDPNFIG